MTCPGMSPSQIILTKKKGKGETDVELTLQCLIRGTAKNPFDWSTGFPAHTPVHSP